MKAFPQTRVTINGDKDIISADLGMDLRDYFAAKALQGMVDRAVKLDLDPELVADDCYKLADAMMEARNERE
jgi:DNA-binding protein YbaB